MKKLLFSLGCIACVSIMAAFAYDMTNTDTMLVDRLSDKIESIVQTKGEQYRDKIIVAVQKVAAKKDTATQGRIIAILEAVLTNMQERKAQANKSGLFEGKVVYNPHKKETYIPTRKMEKPTLTDMKNWDAMQKGFTEKRSTTYTVGQSILDDIAHIKSWMDPKDFATNCTQLEIYSNDSYKNIGSIPLAEVKSGKTITVSDTYMGNGYNGVTMNLPASEKTFFTNHGWVFTDTPRVVREYQVDNDFPVYEDSFDEEWKAVAETIGGSPETYRRYPYNTVFVSTDLLLHTYYRLFENNLKYYEQSFARPLVSDLSSELFTSFVAKQNAEKDPAVKKYYQFLAAFWLIPSSILMPETKLLDVAEDAWMKEDISDDQIEQKIRQDVTKKLALIDPSYRESISNTLDDILAGTAEKGTNYLLEQFQSSFVGPMDIKQDYTQFVPRSYYTTNALLKTYFMGMKYMMRNKLFFNDTAGTTAALVMIHNFTDDQQQRFDTFYDFIHDLIGSDDDINIYDIRSILKKYNWTTDSAIVRGMTDSIRAEMQKLRPQMIMSTTYVTETVGATDEETAKDNTVGFIFFGEKFTSDSWLFDALTAGSAEKEYAFKPAVATALSVPAVVADNAVANELVDLWLDSKENAWLTPDQHAGYLATQKQMKDMIYTYDFSQNMYHSWLDTLNFLFVKQDPKNPYFMQDPLYVYKNLNSYMGSYTELKHATLLYVKQAYAEMGGGGGDDCPVAYMDPPALPVPKGYVEPNIELIDQLITLTQRTQVFYPNDEKLATFLDYLSLVKSIATKEIRNETISDEVFEQLRLSYNTLDTLTTPKPYLGMLTDKEQRGSIIADIFTSGEQGPLYEAMGRPKLMLLMVKDTNGSRVVMGPVYTHYEMYGPELPFDTEQGRAKDEDRQRHVQEKGNPTQGYGLPLQKLMDAMK